MKKEKKKCEYIFEDARRVEKIVEPLNIEILYT
jgi:hypothetical protein